ncbi:hypothetical protein AAVH_05608 [Aphelenchoides avenae]|nr:hypothetical protein AAVH_05608 [Aphelenchus avenae]
MRSSSDSSVDGSKHADTSVIEKKARQTGFSSVGIVITFGIQIIVSGVFACVLFGFAIMTRWRTQVLMEETLLCVSVVEWVLLTFAGLPLCMKNKPGVQIFVLVLFILSMIAEGIFSLTFVSAECCFSFTCDLARVQLYHRAIIWSLLVLSTLAHAVCIAILIATFKTDKSQRHKGSAQSGKDASSSHHHGSNNASHDHTGSHRSVSGGSTAIFTTWRSGRSFLPRQSDAPTLPSADNLLRDVVVMSCRAASKTSPTHAALNASLAADFQRDPLNTAKSPCDDGSWSSSITWSRSSSDRDSASSSERISTLTDDTLWPIARILGGDKSLQSSRVEYVQNQSTNPRASGSYNKADLTDSWYKGRLTREEAERVATRLNLNVFLYSHLSSAAVGIDQEGRGLPLFLCSVSASGQPRHYRVHNCTMASGDVYYYLADFPDEPWFPALKQLVRFYETCNYGSRKAAP